MSEQIRLTIDGLQTTAAPGATILEAARAVGIDIPTLCEEPGITRRAQCRVCLVEIAGRPRLSPACATGVEDGMVVFTDSDRAVNARRMTLDLLLSEHPKKCPTHTSGGECKLCDYAERYGVSARLGHGEPKREVAENAFVSRNAAACVLCSKCVRVCGEVQGIGALAFMGRGNATEVRPALGKTLEQTDCEMCGNCAAACPTGAARAVRMSGVKDARKVRTTCGYCGVGCQFDLNVLNGRVVGVTSAADAPVNGRWLCVKGRFGYEFIHHPDRLTVPLVRRNGRLQAASWDEALDYTAARLNEIKKEHGPDSIAFLSSSRCTNEENYLVQKLARAVIGTNSVDQCART